MQDRKAQATDRGTHYIEGRAAAVQRRIAKLLDRDTRETDPAA